MLLGLLLLSSLLALSVELTLGEKVLLLLSIHSLLSRMCLCIILVGGDPEICSRNMWFRCTWTCCLMIALAAIRAVRAFVRALLLI